MSFPTPFALFKFSRIVFILRYAIFVNISVIRNLRGVKVLRLPTRDQTAKGLHTQVGSYPKTDAGYLSTLKAIVTTAALEDAGYQSSCLLLYLDCQQLRDFKVEIMAVHSYLRLSVWFICEHMGCADEG